MKSLAFASVFAFFAVSASASEVGGLHAMAGAGSASGQVFDGGAARPVLAVPGVTAEEALPAISTPKARTPKVPEPIPDNDGGSGSPGISKGSPSGSSSLWYEVKTVASSTFSLGLFGACVGLIVGAVASAPLMPYIVAGALIGAAAGFLWGVVSALIQPHDNRWS